LKNFDFDFLDKPEVNIKLLVLAFAVISVAIYIGFLIYGNRGLSRLIDLQNNTQILTHEVNKLKKENVKLQKEYFGLKDIEGGK
jgi:cell division protein FtsB